MPDITRPFRSRPGLTWSVVGAAGIITAVVIALLLVEPDTRRVSGTTMGTFYGITYVGGPARAVFEREAEDTLRAIDRQLSTWRSDSWIARFNRRRSTAWTPVPSHASYVIRRALALSDATNGALDPTVGALVDLWGFGPNEGRRPPADSAIRRAMRTSDPDHLRLRSNPPRIRKTDPHLELDLSAVTKGYAADLLGAALRAHGVDRYKVNIGGDLRVETPPTVDSAWTVRIEAPAVSDSDGDPYRTVKLRSGGLATSGDYRRFVEIDGERYPHLLNPETGRPARTTTAGVSIVAPTALEADGLATAAFVLGPKGALRMIARRAGTEGMLITRSESEGPPVHRSPGWRSLLSPAPRKIDE